MTAMTDTLPSHVRRRHRRAGFAGLGMAIRLKRSGIEDFVVLERADDVGGTWRDNTYPGCQCDVPSHLYSFSFAPNPEWTRDVLAAAGDRRLPARVRRPTSASAATCASSARSSGRDWDEERARWRVETSRGLASRPSARRRRGRR